MARIITKELALKIIKKLGAKKVRSGKAHDDYQIEYNGVIIVTTSIRRGSDKDLGHDHMPDDLHIGPSQAKRLGQCSLTEKAYLDVLRDKDLLPEEEETEETEQAEE